MAAQKRTRRQRAQPAAEGQVRIIGGAWRGRKLAFHDAEGLRPTGDRMRETLFNWVQPWIEGADCVDLFAGSGALAFEAASRGAARVVMVENNPVTALQLQGRIDEFKAGALSLWQGSALDYLPQMAEAVDLIFLDPPFHSHLLSQALALIDPRTQLRKGGGIYLEYPLRRPPELPAGLRFIKQKKAGAVGYGLVAHDQA